jgi:hypothetical protein
VVEWAGPEGSDAPASVTLVRAADEASGSATSTWLAAAGLALGLLALGVALRPGRVHPAHP